MESSGENNEPGVSPMVAGSAGTPQKPPAEGPIFNFSAVGVEASEVGLRKAVAELKAMLEVYAGGCRTEIGYHALAAGLEWAMPNLYHNYDAFVQAVLATSNEKVTCARSCSHCCSHYVTSVEPFELLFLHGRIQADARYPGRIIALHRRVSQFKALRQRDVEKPESADAEDKALYRYYLRGQACPFLAEGGSCGIYENRPMSCRMFYSMSHPSLCKGKAVVSPGNRNFLIELPDSIEADLARSGALFADLQLPESLFEGLLSVNEELGRFDAAQVENSGQTQ